MIPKLVRIDGSPYAVLPPGVHEATLAELETCFAYNQQRIFVFAGIERVVNDLVRARCRAFYLGGSFVTDKDDPDDFDGCWDAEGVKAGLLPPELLDFSDNMESQKKKYWGEVFPSHFFIEDGSKFIEFFQRDKFTGRPKGIVKISLAGFSL